MAIAENGSIGALIGRAVAGGSGPQAGIPTLQVPLDQISDNPFQHRLDMDPEKLEELAQSIASSGLLQPILLRRLPTGRWETLAGHRRRAAFSLLRERAKSEDERVRWNCITAIEKVVSDEEMERFALEENLHRDDPSALAYAAGLAHYQQAHSLSAAQVAERLHLELTRVKRFLRLNNAPEVIKQGVTSGLMVPLLDDDGNPVVNDKGKPRQEHRHLDLMGALEFQRLYEFWADGNPRSATDRTESAIRRALTDNWSFRRIQTHCRRIIDGDGAPDEGETGAGKGKRRAVSAWRETDDNTQLTINWKRLAAASVEELTTLRALIDRRLQEAASLRSQPEAPPEPS